MSKTISKIEDDHEESLDDQEIQIVAFTLSRGECRFSDYITEFQNKKSWSHESIIKRIGTKGSLQSKGWISKKLSEEKKRPIYFVPSQKALQSRLLAYALNKEVAGVYHNQIRISIKELDAFYQNISKFDFTKYELNRILEGIAIDVHAKSKIKSDVSILGLSVLLARRIMTLQGKSLEDSGFMIVIDFSPKDGPLRVITPTFEALLGKMFMGFLKDKRWQKLIAKWISSREKQ